MRSVFSSAISRQIRQVPFAFPLVSRVRLTLNIVVPLLQTSMVCAGRSVDSRMNVGCIGGTLEKRRGRQVRQHGTVTSRKLDAVASRQDESTGYIENAAPIWTVWPTRRVNKAMDPGPTSRDLRQGTAGLRPTDDGDRCTHEPASVGR